MNSRKFVVAALVAASMAAAPARAAGPTPSIAAYEAAMRDSDYRQAAREADAFADRHRLDQKDARPDPLLSGLVGRLYMRRGESLIALAYLRHSDSPEVPAPQRIAAGLARGEAEEALGDWSGAARSFERLLALPLDRSALYEARLGLARVRLADDPRAALAAARALASDSPAARRWEAELVSAQALSLLGQSAEADLAADRAWAESVAAATAEAAPIRVALVRAGLAAAAGRRGPLIAMLSAANASLNALDDDIANTAPLCEEAGLTPADYAIFGAHTRTDSAQWLMPIAASRPGAAALFRRAIAGRRLLSKTGAPPGGLVFTLRCRTEISADYAPSVTDSPWTQWFADRGAYFTLAADTELETINRVASQIDALVPRLGEHHPSVIGLRASLLGMLERRAASAPDVERWQVVELHRKIGESLARAGGAESFMPVPEILAERARLEQAGSFDQALAVYRTGFEQMIGRLPPDHAYLAFREWSRADKNLPEATRRRIMESLLGRIGGGPTDPMRRALQRRLGHLAKKAGDARGARAAFASAGMLKDGCEAIEESPRTVDTGMSDEDYPADVLDPNIAGVTMLELDIGADGRVTRSRPVLAVPSLLFDPVVEAKLPAFRYSPATEQGRPRACRSLQQTIRWRMPPEEPMGPPIFAPIPEGAS